MSNAMNLWRSILIAGLAPSFLVCTVFAGEPARPVLVAQAGPPPPSSTGAPATTDAAAQRDRDIASESLLIHYRSKQVTGIVLAGAVAPLFAGLTVLGTLQIYRHGIEDDGGFCNHVYYDEFRDEYDTNCEGDRGEVAGMVLVASFGTATTLGVLIPGIVMAVKYSSRLRLLRYRNAQADAASDGMRLEPVVGPGSAALRVHF